MLTPQTRPLPPTMTKLLSFEISLGGLVSLIYLPSLAISGHTGVELQLFHVRPHPFLVFIAPPFGGIARNLTHMVFNDAGTSLPSFMMIH